jgi:DNA-binding LytR/AlgR family response regulator
MKVLIIEDEPLAARHLQKLLNEIDTDCEIVAVLESVKSAVKWFQTQPLPDLAFLDIQLADGLSFEIFEHVNISIPVIFTTAYDEYALRAFKLNSIDYLLKPIDPNALKNSIIKFKAVSKPKESVYNSAVFEKLLQAVAPGYKKRFLIKVGDHLRFIETLSVDYFVSIEKSSFLCSEGRLYDLEFSLDELEPKLDPTLFFRANRKYIISVQAIADMVSWSGSRLMIRLKYPVNEEVIVSREKVGELKKWLDC